MKSNNVKQSSEPIIIHDESITFKRYDVNSKFLISVTTIQTECPYGNEKKVLDILKKNFIARNCDQ